MLYKMPKSALLSDVGITEEDFQLAKEYLATIPESEKFSDRGFIQSITEAIGKKLSKYVKN